MTEPEHPWVRAVRQLGEAITLAINPDYRERLKQYAIDHHGVTEVDVKDVTPDRVRLTNGRVIRMDRAKALQVAKPPIEHYKPPEPKQPEYRSVMADFRIDRGGNIVRLAPRGRFVGSERLIGQSPLGEPVRREPKQ